MNRYLFTIAIGVEDRPQRWLGICSIYASLARGLMALGHEVSFIVNPEALHSNSLSGLPFEIGDHERLRRILAKQSFDFAFIWGGRIEPDRVTRAILEENSIVPVFSELGWFPQKGTVYFDLQGTNSQITAESLPPLGTWRRIEFQAERLKLSWSQYRRLPVLRRRPMGPSPLRVLVPLQDETDTNITDDSPFTRMNDFVAFLARTYPNDHFVIRPHPRAEIPYIDEYNNVELQEVSINPIATLSAFDLVVGINSTLLSEAAFLGNRVACCGNGIARIFGLTKQLDVQSPPARLQDIGTSKWAIEAFSYLVMIKQLSQSKLSQPHYLTSSYLDAMLRLQD